MNNLLILIDLYSQSGSELLNEDILSQLEQEIDNISSLCSSDIFSCIQHLRTLCLSIKNSAADLTEEKATYLADNEPFFSLIAKLVNYGKEGLSNDDENLTVGTFLAEEWLQVLQILSQKSEKVHWRICIQFASVIISTLVCDELLFINKLQLLKNYNILVGKINATIKEKMIGEMDVCKKLDFLACNLALFGDYDYQAAIIELLFRIFPRTMLHQRASDIYFCHHPDFIQPFLALTGSNFETNLRNFLNDFNNFLVDKKLVYSIPCESIKVGDTMLLLPPSMEQNFVDFNVTTSRMTVFCLAVGSTSEDEEWEVMSIYQHWVTDAHVELSLDRKMILMLQLEEDFSQLRPDWPVTGHEVLIEFSVDKLGEDAEKLVEVACFGVLGLQLMFPPSVSEDPIVSTNKPVEVSDCSPVLCSNKPMLSQCDERTSGPHEDVELCRKECFSPFTSPDAPLRLDLSIPDSQVSKKLSLSKEQSGVDNKNIERDDSEFLNETSESVDLFSQDTNDIFTPPSANTVSQELSTVEQFYGAFSDLPSVTPKCAAQIVNARKGTVLSDVEIVNNAEYDQINGKSIEVTSKNSGLPVNDYVENNLTFKDLNSEGRTCRPEIQKCAFNRLVKQADACAETDNDLGYRQVMHVKKTRRRDDITRALRLHEVDLDITEDDSDDDNCTSKTKKQRRYPDPYDIGKVDKSPSPMKRSSISHQQSTMVKSEELSPHVSVSLAQMRRKFFSRSRAERLADLGVSSADRKCSPSIWKGGRGRKRNYSFVSKHKTNSRRLAELAIQQASSGAKCKTTRSKKTKYTFMKDSDDDSIIIDDESRLPKLVTNYSVTALSKTKCLQQLAEFRKSLYKFRDDFNDLVEKFNNFECSMINNLAL